VANFQLRALAQAARILGGEDGCATCSTVPPGAFAR